MLLLLKSSELTDSINISLTSFYFVFTSLELDYGVRDCEWVRVPGWRNFLEKIFSSFAFFRHFAILVDFFIPRFLLLSLMVLKERFPRQSVPICVPSVEAHLEVI